MARIDFYVLQASGVAARRLFACRLAEKAYRLQNRVHLLAGDPDSVRELDDLLWTFRDGSFLPHEVAPGSSGAPVTISCDGAAVDGCDLLINLSDELPGDLDAFPRIAEIVTSDDDQKRRSRARFADYRDRGHELETHKL